VALVSAVATNKAVRSRAPYAAKRSRHHKPSDDRNQADDGVEPRE
jgi:hypothetical protein